MGGPAETAATSGQIDFQRVMNRSSEIKLTCNESPALIFSSFCLCPLEASSQPVHIPQPSRCRHKRSASPAPASATKETVMAVFQLLSPFINGRKNQQTSEKVRTSSRRPSDSRHRSQPPNYTAPQLQTNHRRHIRIIHEVSSTCGSSGNEMWPKHFIFTGFSSEDKDEPQGEEADLQQEQ